MHATFFKFICHEITKMKLKYDIMVDVVTRRYFETKRSGGNEEQNEINNSLLNLFTPHLIRNQKC